MTLRSLVKKNI